MTTKRTHHHAPLPPDEDRTPTAPAQPAPSDPRLRWPTAIVLCVVCVCITATLIFARGDTQEALLAILGTLGTGLASVLPSLLAPKASQ